MSIFIIVNVTNDKLNKFKHGNRFSDLQQAQHAAEKSSRTERGFSKRQ